MGSRVGGALVRPLEGFTVSRNVSLAAAVPSLTVTVMMAVPERPAVGVTVTERAEPVPPNTMALVGTSAGLDEARVRVRLAGAVSMSPTVNASAAVAVSWLMVWSAMLPIVGGSLAALTVIVKEVELEAAPSETRRVTVADPDWLVAGVI